MLGHQEVNDEAELDEAIARTRQGGLGCPDISFNTQRYLTNDFIGRIVKSAQRVTGHLRPSDLMGQCFAVHHFMKDSIEQDLGVPLFKPCRTAAQSLPASAGIEHFMRPVPVATTATET